MSVFKRPGASTYSYDFWVRGRRFSGSTSCKKKVDAERWEANKKRELRAAQPVAAEAFGFEAATVRFMEEVGQFHAAPDDTMRYMAWLTENIGPTVPLSAVTNPIVASLVAKRRGEGVSPSTVNRSVVEPLRNLLRTAHAVWELDLPRIDWKRHRLKEPQERVREASAEEEEKLLKLIPSDYRPAIRFAILTGCRRGEIVGLRWAAVSFTAREFRVTGKGDRSRTIPMSGEVLKLLKALEGQHPTAVFTFAAQRTRQGRIKGERYPITADGLQTVWNRHVRGHMEDFRFHDTRHTAATRLVRVTGNLKLAQRLLGHTNVTTTSRYAHVTHEDLRAALETVERPAPSPTEGPTEGPDDGA